MSLGNAERVISLSWDRSIALSSRQRGSPVPFRPTLLKKAPEVHP